MHAPSHIQLSCAIILFMPSSTMMSTEQGLHDIDSPWLRMPPCHRCPACSLPPAGLCLSLPYAAVSHASQQQLVSAPAALLKPQQRQTDTQVHKHADLLVCTLLFNTTFTPTKTVTEMYKRRYGIVYMEILSARYPQYQQEG